MPWFLRSWSHCHFRTEGTQEEILRLFLCPVFLYLVSSFALCYCDEHYHQKQLGKEQVYFTLQVVFIIRESPRSSTRWEPGRKNWRRQCGEMLPTDFFTLDFSVTFLRQLMTTWPGMAPLAVVWAFLSQWSI